jgi:hypothetical protein
MTRDEAIDKVEAVYYGLRKHPLGPGAQAVDTLVALGLLDLDEPKSVQLQATELLTYLFVDDARAQIQPGDAARIINYLNANGFKIVKAQR